MKYCLNILILLIALNGFGQEKQNIAQPSDTNTVRIFQDKRIHLILQKLHSENIQRRGFRIQIYSGINRQQAKATELSFQKVYQDIPAYFIYDQPNFRVRVGNFISRKDAYAFYLKIRTKYSCMIVPAIITVK